MEIRNFPRWSSTGRYAVSKVQNPRLKNADKDYHPDDINQIIRVLEQIIQTLNTNYGVERQLNAEAVSYFKNG